MNQNKSEMDIAIDAEVLEMRSQLAQKMQREGREVDPVRLMHHCQTVVCSKYGEPVPSALPTKEAPMGGLGK